MKSTGYFEQIYGIVRRVPPGRVTTYGTVARLAGQPGGGRTVGWALRGLRRETDLPWHRIINAQGRISLPSPAKELQRALLEREGVEFDGEGRVDLTRFGWGRRAEGSARS